MDPNLTELPLATHDGDNESSDFPSVLHKDNKKKAQCKRVKHSDDGVVNAGDSYDEGEPLDSSSSKDPGDGAQK